MKIIDKVTLYVNICDELKEKNIEDLKKLLEIQRLKAKESKLTVPEYLTLIILHKFSHVKTLKAFWYQEKYFSNNAWPNMPSYPRFIIWNH